MLKIVIPRIGLAACILAAVQAAGSPWTHMHQQVLSRCLSSLCYSPPRISPQTWLHDSTIAVEPELCIVHGCTPLVPTYYYRSLTTACTDFTDLLLL